MLERLNRAQLASLAREYMLSAHFNSRTGYAALQINHGEATYKPVAIDNWMAVSPIYTNRMQELMKLRGDSDVETIFKGMQLEVGFAHQYFEVHFRMTGPEEGEFWLPSCGPLLEVEPLGEQRVRTMCHDIEDPTFDATAMATNPTARVRPIHRPPRAPVDRSPFCHWRVYLDSEAEPLQETTITARMRDTSLAGLPLGRGQNSEPGGLDDYSGPLFEQMHLEVFSRSALTAICREIAIQNHLLINSLWWAIADRFGEEAADAVVAFQMEGASWMMSERLSNWLNCGSDDIGAMQQVLAIHPAFQPEDYYQLMVFREDDQLRLRFEAAPAADDATPLGWYRLLEQGNASGLEGLLRGVNRRVSVTSDGDDWLVTLDADKQPAEDPLSVQIARGSVLYKTQLEDQPQLLEVTG